jgi:3-oxoacyl-[acyl-carrier protein] reductase
MSLRVARVALVTGSSRGLGKAIALRLAADGHAVAVNALEADPDLQAVVSAIREGGGTAQGFAADVTDEQEVLRLVTEIRDALGPIDTLVLNATGPQPTAPLDDVGWSEHMDQLRFFLKSPVDLVRAVVEDMRKAGFGRIVTIDSEVAFRSPPGRTAYAAAKSAEIGLAMALARELAGFGITVNSVGPGFVPVERHADVPQSELDAYLQTVPAGRLGTPAEIAHAVSFFASTGAGFVTGQRLLVDGGKSLT